VQDTSVSTTIRQHLDRQNPAVGKWSYPFGRFATERDFHEPFNEVSDERSLGVALDAAALWEVLRDRAVKYLDWMRAMLDVWELSRRATPALAGRAAPALTRSISGTRWSHFRACVVTWTTILGTIPNLENADECDVR